MRFLHDRQIESLVEGMLVSRLEEDGDRITTHHRYMPGNMTMDWPCARIVRVILAEAFEYLGVEGSSNERH